MAIFRNQFNSRTGVGTFCTMEGRLWTWSAHQKAWTSWATSWPVWGARFRCAAKWPDHKPQNPVIIAWEVENVSKRECQKILSSFHYLSFSGSSEIPNKVTWPDTALTLPQQVFKDLHRPKTFRVSDQDSLEKKRKSFTKSSALEPLRNRLTEERSLARGSLGKISVRFYWTAQNPFR